MSAFMYMICVVQFLGPVLLLCISCWSKSSADNSFTGRLRSFEDTLPSVNASSAILFRSIVHPLWPYFVCRFYIGNEKFHAKTVTAVFDGGVDAVRLNSTADVDIMEEYDTLYVPVQFFPHFVQDYLPLLSRRILLVTGQYMKPQLNVSKQTNIVLNHPMVAHWFMQNVIYEHKKVTHIPYGIHHEKLELYVNYLRGKGLSHLKHGGIRLFPMNYKTNPDRQQLKPYLEVGHRFKLTYTQFLDGLASAYYVISPAGDRPDTYRHWEAIGLGAIPVCNCPRMFQQLFKDDMLIKEVPTMIELLNLSNTSVRDMYHEPDRSLVLLSHWRAVIEHIKESLQA